MKNSTFWVTSLGPHRRSGVYCIRRPVSQIREFWRICSYKTLTSCRNDILVGFVAANEAGVRAVNTDLGRVCTGVVVEGHDHAVSVCGEDTKKRTAIKSRQKAVLGQKVAALADWPDDVPMLRLPDRGFGVIPARTTTDQIRWND